MRNTNSQFLRKKVYQATLIILKQPNTFSDIPLEYYADEILRQTLSYCATDFLSQSLRDSEQYALTELQNDLRKNTDITVLETRLMKNLAKIKPKWGEFFGTDRGTVYNTIHSLYEWPCFTLRSRLYYKNRHQQKFNILLTVQVNKLSEQKEQLSSAGSLLQKHEKTNHEITQRAASQFIALQQLKMENTSLKNELNLAKKTIEEQNEQLRHYKKTTLTNSSG